VSRKKQRDSNWNEIGKGKKKNTL